MDSLAGSFIIYHSGLWEELHSKYLLTFIIGSIHHYFPALYFGIISFTAVSEFFGKKLGNIGHKVLLSGLIIATIAVYFYFYQFSFGMKGPAIEWKSRQWNSNWKFFDGNEPFKMPEIIDEDE